MRISSRLLIVLSIVAVAASVLVSEQVGAAGLMQLRKMPATLPPEEYGNIVLNRLAEKNGQQKVVFPHWSHRAKFTCRVCHLELEFSMRAGETPITETLIREGRYCGICHNGKTAFAPKGSEGENCKRCHSGGTKIDSDKFKAFATKLPTAPFGNKIDWMQSLDKGLIKPKNSLFNDKPPMTLDRQLELKAEMAMISPAVFPHKAHTKWLECSQCHPDIFNIKKKTTEHFTMDKNLDNQFCGVCHLRIAFPLNDCKRCHPGMRAPS